MVLTEEQKQEIVRRLVAEFRPIKIILFGSQAWGTPGPDSDVDMFVIVERSDERRVQRSVRALGCLRGLKFPKDVLVRTRDEVDRYKDVYASLECEVLERGKVLYEQN